ncbi:MAG: glycoside hydrolase family 27 protein [Ignavibacteriaceae bacterium]|nr:glycoside hydrolase family 27 protein [Ignavibacteriaceae bacterium]
MNSEKLIKSSAMYLVALVFIITYNTSFAQKFENLALTPPMGWNSWNHFACDINENIIKQMADKMVSSGMKDAGYVYINIDDCWQGNRDTLGFIHPNPERFPSGIKHLADYVHSKGLKLGIYSCAGNKTCAGYLASRGHEYQDAITFAKWEIDYLKYDWCNTEGLNAIGAYTTMRDALFEAARPIVFSLCEWGNNKPWEWGALVGHLWRTTGDIYNCFDCIKDHGTWKSWGVTYILDMQDGLRKYAGPDHWNDPDMMEVGNGMSINEDRAHFSLWCMLAAPLICGNDLRSMTKDVIDILTNKEVIAIDQDRLGIQGFKYSSNDSIEVWFKPLENNDWAMCVLNRNSESRTFIFDWQKENVVDDIWNISANFKSITYGIKDLWKKKIIGNTDVSFKAEIPGHDVVMLRLIKSTK